MVGPFGTLIVRVATSMAMFGASIQDLLTNDTKGLNTTVVTGKIDPQERQIDEAVGSMPVALTSVDAIEAMDDPSLSDEKTNALLFIGLSPWFILCLLFDQTKDLFKCWLFYGIGTMFSMAELAAMVGIALDMVIRVASTFWLTAAADKWILQDSGAVGFTSQAMQQGGMGLIFTTLILTAPPMAAMFFQGTLGGFMAYSQMGGSAAASPQGQPPGAVPEEKKVDTSRQVIDQAAMPQTSTRTVTDDSTIMTPGPGGMGSAVAKRQALFSAMDVVLGGM